jgi:hypothetical protein
MKIATVLSPPLRRSHSAAGEQRVTWESDQTAQMQVLFSGDHAKKSGNILIEMSDL